MSSDLQELYQEVILDHNKRPRNFHALDPARQVEGYNPLCGDRLTVYARVEGDRVQDVAFLGSGCAISKASASLMTDAVKGMRVADAIGLIDRFHEMVTSPSGEPAGDLGKLSALAGVREFPMRVKCAILAWHALRAVLADHAETVSTE